MPQCRWRLVGPGYPDPAAHPPQCRKKPGPGLIGPQLKASRVLPFFVQQVFYAGDMVTVGMPGAFARRLLRAVPTLAITGQVRVGGDIIQTQCEFFTEHCLGHMPVFRRQGDHHSIMHLLDLHGAKGNGRPRPSGNLCSRGGRLPHGALRPGWFPGWHDPDRPDEMKPFDAEFVKASQG